MGCLLILVQTVVNPLLTAIGFLCPRFRIESFEPNPSLRGDLDFIKRILGERFNYHPVGLGDKRGKFTLYVPMLGGLPITTRASVRRDAVLSQLQSLADEHGSQGSILEVNIDVFQFDEFGLRPDAVKIDVEGHELSVLHGMRHTISECRPVFLIEKNSDMCECQEFLSSFDYLFYEYDSKAKALVAKAQYSSRHWFAIPKNVFLNFVQL